MDLISVVIPAYKKTDMLVSNLKHNLPYLKGAEIIVVNDDPTQSIEKDCDGLGIILIENTKNLGFGGAVNVGFARATHQYVLLLNSDVRLIDNSWKRLLTSIKDRPTCFAISCAQKERDGSVIGKNTIYWEQGFFHHEKSPSIHSGPTAWAEGGSCIVSKNLFETLGGFDTVYKPFYWEDVDLSYRAWKSGYEVLFDKSVLVEHHHESTIGTYFQKNTIFQIALRNQLIFMWKNLDTAFLTAHLKILPRFVLGHVFDVATLRGVLSAVGRIPDIMRMRRKQRTLYKRADVEVLAILAK